jgi:feruloyl esterase
MNLSSRLPPRLAASAALANQAIPNANLLSASVVPAKGDLPEHCRVLGYVRPPINFEVRLPARDWNGKFYMAGCGRFCGTVDSNSPGFTNAINHGLRRNYAVSTMDSGHWGTSVLDGRWAWHNRLAEIDWGLPRRHRNGAGVEGDHQGVLRTRPVPGLLRRLLHRRAHG